MRSVGSVTLRDEASPICDIHRMTDSKQHGGWWDVTLQPSEARQLARDMAALVLKYGIDPGTTGQALSDALSDALDASKRAAKKAKKREAKRRKQRFGMGGSALIGSYSKRSTGQRR